MRTMPKKIAPPNMAGNEMYQVMRQQAGKDGDHGSKSLRMNPSRALFADSL